MELYFNYLPSELNNIVLSYLEYEELVDLDEIITVNYEQLFAIKLPFMYKDIKEIFRIDKTIGRYRNKWDLLFKDFLNDLDDDELDNIKKFTKFNSISFNIYYTVYCYKEYPIFFWFKDYLYNRGLKSDYLPYYIFSTFSILESWNVDTNEKFLKINHQFLFDNLKYVTSEYLDYNTDTDSDQTISYAIICYLLFESPNFGLSPTKTIDNVIEVLGHIPSYNIENGETLLYIIYDDIVTSLDKYIGTKYKLN